LIPRGFQFLEILRQFLRCFSHLVSGVNWPVDLKVVALSRQVTIVAAVSETALRSDIGECLIVLRSHHRPEELLESLVIRLQQAVDEE